MCRITEISPQKKQYIWGAETWYEPFAQSPILVKTIEAKESLSIQVHPDDAYASLNETQSGKTELWYVTNAEQGAGVYYGFKENLSREQVLGHIQNDTIEEVLNFYKVKRGDVFFVEAGTVHAIGKGVSLVEVQQNSSLTYRIYDYGRVDANGNKRELHIDKALDVMQRDVESIQKPFLVDEASFVVAGCKHFSVSAHHTSLPEEIAKRDTFQVIYILEGSGKITEKSSEVFFEAGQVFFIPPNAHNSMVVPTQPVSYLISYPSNDIK